MGDGAPPLVAHVIHRLAHGGLENGLVNLINHMPPDRYGHAVVCLAGFSDFRERIRRPEVGVYSVDKRPGKDPAAYLRLWRLLRRLRPAILHTRNLGTVDCQWIGAAAGVRRRVHGEHGWEASDPQGRNRKSLRLRRACRPLVQRYVTMSRHLADWLESEVGVEPTRITQIYSGVDSVRFAPTGALPADLPWPADGPGRPFVVGTVARLDPVKNQRLLLEAFALLGRDRPGAETHLRLVIAGDGPLRGELEEQARALALHDRVWFAGARDDIPDLLRAMDVFALPSLNEGISNTILEAMACGRPVVASRVGGNPELVEEGVTGMLFESGSAQALAEALSRYANDARRRAAQSEAARIRVERHFSLRSMVQDYLGVYDSLMTRGN